MRKAVFFIIPAIVFAFLIVLYLIFSSNDNKNADNNSMVLKSYNGKVALYENDNTTPKNIYDIYIESLPQADRESLEVGIEINNNAELESLLQDFDE